MAEESAEATSDTGSGVNVSVLPDHGPVAERRREVDFSLKCIKDKWIPITVTVVITALIITVIALASSFALSFSGCSSLLEWKALASVCDRPAYGPATENPRSLPLPTLPTVRHCCVPGRLGGIPRKCYYFSETEGNWNNSQSNCSSLNASLASIDSLLELDFMLRYKGIPYHWIGLWREQGEGQPWKWTNGTIFNNLFQVRGEGHCAYLDEYGVSSSRCYSERHFICKWPDDCSRREAKCRRRKQNV